MSQVIIDHITPNLSSYLKENGFSKVAVLVDENTKEHCYPIIENMLPNHHLVEITSGEVNKTLETCSYIWKQLTELGFDRKSLLINLGGGVIGDMGGFCAATYKRGIRFVNIPTTLLAAVDANVGGKLGIDFMGFKNHIGCFQEPDAVFIDSIFLKTLPKRELRSGFAEVLKHGIIADKDYFEACVSQGLEQTHWNDIIAHSVYIKEAIVAEDPKEAGLRKVLNFGHSIGHAIESFYLNSEQPLLHGEAIAAGMICEAFLSKKMLGLEVSSLNKITQNLLTTFGNIPLQKQDFPQIVGLMYQDKKNVNNLLNHSLISAIGVATYDIAVDEKEVLDALFYYEQL